MKKLFWQLNRFSGMLILLYFITGTINLKAQNYDWIDLDTVQAGRFDTGRMWTFEFPPLDYFKEAYGIDASDEWLDHIRLSALRFATYCSASFVSEDGLIMTNHHCARQSLTDVSQEGEDLTATGFWAPTMNDERPVPGLFVDQLVLIKDVTDEVLAAIDEGTTDAEKLEKKMMVIEAIETREAESSGLEVSVTELFDGAKYSLYGYKRYNDIRLVFAPEDQAGFFGGDPDNFTYPRYNLDCTFFRAYDENGNPLKTDNFFKWSEDGPADKEPVFVVGNPGSTNRLKTVSQLEYYRDIQYPRTTMLLKDLEDVYGKLLAKYPDRKMEYQDMIFSFANARKSYEGRLEGLRDPVLMQKKRVFENEFKSAVNSNSEMREKYGDLWDMISGIRKELKSISNELFVLSLSRFTSSEYFNFAKDVVEIANQLKLPEEERSELYKGEELNYTIKSIVPEEFDSELADMMLEKQIVRMEKFLGSDHQLVKKMTGGRKGKEAVEYMLDKTVVNDVEKIKELIEEGPDAILNSEDPFIYFVVNSTDKAENLQQQVSELNKKEEAFNNQLGRAIFEVYGTSIPPDATFTLRISDGIVKGFEYNGTMAPPFTTFYGMYDRYYGFGKNFPWVLPEKWKNPPADFNLDIPFNFVSTNDIIGGNSGSPVINKNAEVVGLAFDGNMESLPGDFIFTTEKNRTVSVHSAGMYEVINDLYGAKRLASELKNGKINKLDKKDKTD
jgi:hypothetical protein